MHLNRLLLELIIQMNKSISIYETKMKINMKKWNDQHKLELNQNYGLDNGNSSNNDKHIMAQYIKNNFDKMNSDNMKNTLIKIINDKRTKNILLEYELKYLKLQPQNMTLDEFETAAQKILERYQCKAGGFYIEDRIWTVHKIDSTKHDVKENELLFENSVDKYDFDDNDTQKYLKRIVKKLDSLSNDIKIDYNYKSSKDDGIIWLFIWCTHIENDNDNIKIEL